MDWLSFPIFALFTALFLTTGCGLLFLKKKSQFLRFFSDILIVCGIGCMAVFISFLWIHLSRPPLRTLGETRLWHSFFLVLIGYIAYKRWNYSLFLLFCILMSMLFLLLNYLHPENYDKTLMPALQSVWFVPHVVVYILGYALLFGSAIVAVIGLSKYYFRHDDDTLIHMADNLVYLGFALLTLGLLFGALWAKQAWGNYWTWDPKETWALLTWLGYLIYIHLRNRQPNNTIAPLWILSLAFIILLVAWFGINYLPSAQNSVHVYSNQ